MPPRPFPSYNTDVPTDVTQRQRIALRPAEVFDGLKLVVAPTIVIEDGRILGVERGRADLGNDVAVVDLPGRTLVPGLIDTHVHLCFDGGPDPVAALDGLDDLELSDVMETAARRQLRAGVTTVRDLGDRGFVSVGFGSSGDPSRPRPTVVSAGPPLTTVGGHCDFLGGAIGGGAEAARVAVADHADRGVDVIKVMASGGFLTPGTAVERAQFEPGVLGAIVDEAHRRGLPVVAHAHSAVAVAAAVDAGVDGIEHCTFVTDTGIEAPPGLIERIARNRIVVGSTLGVLPGMSPPPRIAEILDDVIAVHARMHAAGVAIVAGTDAGIGPPKPHGILPHAAAELVGLGFSPVEALRAMTADAARVCGLGDSKGRIAPGFDADLLVVSGDPLSDLAALRDVESVYLAGRALDLGAL